MSKKNGKTKNKINSKKSIYRKPPSMSRDWMVTVPADSMTLEELRQKLSRYRWIGQKEKGEESTELNPQGYEHYQIFVCNDTPIRFTTLKNKLPKAHLQARSEEEWSSRQACFDYCTKEDTRIDGPWKNGSFDGVLKAEQGKRKDLEELKSLILDQNMTVAQVAARDSRSARYISYLREVEKAKYEALYKEAQENSRDVKVIWLYGKPGSGKTYHAREMAGGYQNTYRVSNWDRDPFQGYNAQQSIIFDEFFGSVKFDDLMNYLDSEPLLLPARYGDKVACYTTVYVCSNLAPWQVYGNLFNRDERIGGLYRRITQLLHVYKGEDDKRVYEDETARLRDISSGYVAGTDVREDEEEFDFF